MGRLRVEINPIVIDACAQLIIGQTRQLSSGDNAIQITREDVLIKIEIQCKDVESSIKHAEPSDYCVQVQLYDDNHFPGANDVLLAPSNAPDVENENNTARYNIINCAEDTRNSCISKSIPAKVSGFISPEYKFVQTSDKLVKPSTHCCDICDASFLKVTHLRAHVSSSHAGYDDFLALCQNLSEDIDLGNKYVTFSDVESDSEVLDTPVETAVEKDNVAANQFNHSIKESCDKRGQTSKSKKTTNTNTKKLSDHMFKCSKCDKQFKALEYLKHHVKRKHSNDLAMLTEIETQRALARKKKLGDRKKDLVSCPVCGLGFQKHAKGIFAHMSKVHPKYDAAGFLETIKSSNSPEKNTTNKGKTDSESPIKPTETSVNGAVSDEEEKDQIVTHDSSLKCELCGKTFVDSVIIFHLENEHAQDENIQNIIQQYRAQIQESARQAQEQETREAPPQTCMYCGKTCKKVVQHMRRCRDNPDGVRTKQCICGFRVQDQKELTEHKITCKLNSATFLCDLCGLEFSSKSNMYYHRRSKHRICGKNRNLSTCPCPVCGKVFPAPSRLRKHMTVHTGVRDYVCEICGKDFKISEHLRHHVLTAHLGRYRYHCDKCGHGINKKQKLKTHKCDRVRRLTGAETGTVAREKREAALRVKLKAKEAESQASKEEKHVTSTLRNILNETMPPEFPQLDAATFSSVESMQVLPAVGHVGNVNEPTKVAQAIKHEFLKTDLANPLFLAQGPREIKNEIQSVMFIPNEGAELNLQQPAIADIVPVNHAAQNLLTNHDIEIKRQTTNQQAFFTPDIASSHVLIGQSNSLSLTQQPVVTMSTSAMGGALLGNNAFDYLNAMNAVNTIAPGVFDGQQFRVASDGSYAYPINP